MFTRSLCALTVVMAVSSPFSALADTFPDVPTNHWAKDAVDEATNRNLMKAFPDGTFRGIRWLSRAEFALGLKTFLDEFEAAAKTDLKASPRSNMSFRDLPAASAATITLLANDYGAYDGIADMSDGTFKPNKPINRYEYAQILSNLLQRAEDKDILNIDHHSAVDTTPFKDLGTNPVQNKAVEQAGHHYNILEGFPDNTFHGEEGLNRYQFAASIIKPKKKLKAPVAVQPTPEPTAYPTTPEPTPTPDPMVTQADDHCHVVPNQYELSGMYSLFPNGTFGFPGTTGNMAFFLNGGQELGGGWNLKEAVRYLPNSPGNLSHLGSVGLGVDYRWEAGKCFFIVPSLGVDMWANMGGTANQTSLAGTVGPGLGFEWFPHPMFSIGLGGSGKVGFASINTSGGAHPGSLFTLGQGDLKLRFYPLERLSIQLGATALGAPRFNTNSQLQIDFLAGPNAGIAWQF